MLTEDDPGPADLSREAWFVELPSADWARDLTLQLEDDNPPIVGRTPRSLLRSRAATLEFVGAGRAPRPEVLQESLEDGPSLRDYLRSYLNRRPGAEANNAGGQPAAPASAPLRQGEIAPDALGSGRAMVDRLIAQAVGGVLTPNLGEAGVLTFSVFGMGEFMLFAGAGGRELTLTLGDSGLFTLGMAEAALTGGVAGPMLGDPFAASLGASGEQGGAHAALGGDEGRAGSGDEVSSGPASQGRPTLRLLGLLYEIVTYPGTLLVVAVLAGIRIVQFVRRQIEFGLSRRH